MRGDEEPFFLTGVSAGIFHERSGFASYPRWSDALGEPVWCFLRLSWVMGCLLGLRDHVLFLAFSDVKMVDVFFIG